jgi:hypothetical protein
MVNGKRYFRSLSTGDKELAATRARNFLKAAQGDRFDLLEQSKLRKDYATIGEICELYAAAARTRDIRVRTAQDYMGSLSVIVRKTHPGANVENLSTGVLTRDLVETYVGSVMAAAGDESLSRDRASRTARSTLRQARALFSRWAMEAYRKVKLPDLSGFMESDPVRNVPITYRLPSQDLIDRTISGGRELRKNCPDLYRVFLLCYDLGMRGGEPSTVANAPSYQWGKTQVHRTRAES